MKGVSLPINVIIILVLGIVVLLGIITFFNFQFRNASGTMSSSAEFQIMCSRWSMLKCDSTYWNSDKLTVYGKNVSEICKKYGYSDADTCSDACCG